jgi:hypothetical protein
MTLLEAVASWMTHLSQENVAPEVVNDRMDMMLRLMDYIADMDFVTGPYKASDVVSAHYSLYEEMARDLDMDAHEVRFLFETINGFLTFVTGGAAPYALVAAPHTLHRVRRGTSTTHAHLRLISVLKRMMRKQKRGVVGVLLERHRELQEADDLMRRVWG